MVGKLKGTFRVKFPDSFSLSANEKHFGNTQELLKLIDEIITPYVEKEREMLDLGEKQQALLMIDEFSVQITDLVIEKLKENNIKLMRVYQSIDLTVNGSAKVFLTKKFTEWYSSSISRQLEKRKSIEDIDLELKLS